MCVREYDNLQKETTKIYKVQYMYTGQLWTDRCTYFLSGWVIQEQFVVELTDRQTDKQTDIQTDRYRQRDNRWTEADRHRQTETERRQMNRIRQTQTDRQTDKQTNRQTYTLTDRYRQPEADIHTDRQTDPHDRGSVPRSARLVSEPSPQKRGDPLAATTH